MAQYRSPTLSVNSGSPLVAIDSKSPAYLQECVSPEAKQRQVNVSGHGAPIATNKDHDDEAELQREVRPIASHLYQALDGISPNKNAQFSDHTTDEDSTNLSTRHSFSQAHSHGQAMHREQWQTSRRDNLPDLPLQPGHALCAIPSSPPMPPSGSYISTQATGAPAIPAPAFNGREMASPTRRPRAFEASIQQQACTHYRNLSLVQDTCPSSSQGNCQIRWFRYPFAQSQFQEPRALHYHHEGSSAPCTHSVATDFQMPTHWAADTIGVERTSQQRQLYCDVEGCSTHSGHAPSDAISAYREQFSGAFEPSARPVNRQTHSPPAQRDIEITIPLYYETPEGTRTIQYRSRIPDTSGHDPKETGVTGRTLSP